MSKVAEIEIPNEAWYIQQGRKVGLRSHCTIAAIDKCPRYFASLRLVDDALPYALNLEMEDRETLEKQWKYAATFSNADSEAYITCHRDGKEIKGLGNFCPEVSALYFGLYCTDLRGFADEDHRETIHRQFKTDQLATNDPRWDWAIIRPCHFSCCKEFAIYGSASSTQSRTSKKRSK